MALVALPLTASGALAEDPELIRFGNAAHGRPLVVDTTKIRKVTSFKPPPLILPDIQGRILKLSKADRSILPAQLTKSKQVIAFFENPKYKWVLAPRQDKCWNVPWQRQCTIARAKLRMHHELAEQAQHRLYYELPITNDWLTALRIVQRVYPGTYDRLYFLSDREGGFGPWVWWSGSCGSPPCLWHGYHIGHDSTGDTVGGWMQFRWSTFAPWWRATVKDLKRRGFEIPQFPDRGGPAEYQPWLDPLGQALTAAYMHYSGNAGCHWCL